MFKSAFFTNVDRPVWVDTYYAVSVFFREQLHLVELFHFFSDEHPLLKLECQCLHNPSLTAAAAASEAASGVHSSLAAI